MTAPVANPRRLDAAALRAAYDGFRAANPRAYLRAAANALETSELELLVAIRADDLTRLRDDDWPGLFRAFESLGRVWTMTRNEQVVIEREGVFENAKMGEHVGQTVGETIELRAFPKAWAHAVAVAGDPETNAGAQIQLYDAAGASIHKVRFAKDGDRAAWDALLDEWRHETPFTALPAVTPPTPGEPKADAEVDVDAFRADWDALTDTHRFFGMLREHGVDRQQAFRLAGESRARRTTVAAFETVLHAAAEAGEKIMIFAGNRGMLQIHIGVIERVVRTRGWLNVMDPGVNVHIDDAHITSAWVVTKPTSDGPVHSFEAFNAAGECVAMLFSKRMEGETEQPWWPALLETLPPLEA